MTDTTSKSHENSRQKFESFQQIKDEEYGVDFDAVCTNSVPMMIDGYLLARYISAEDLITNKLASGRPQDIADVDAIRNHQRVTKNQ